MQSRTTGSPSAPFSQVRKECWHPRLTHRRQLATCTHEVWHQLLPTSSGRAIGSGRGDTTASTCRRCHLFRLACVRTTFELGFPHVFSHPRFAHLLALGCNKCRPNALKSVFCILYTWLQPDTGSSGRAQCFTELFHADSCADCTYCRRIPSPLDSSAQFAQFT